MRAQRIKIALIWLGFSGVTFALLIMQMIFGRYEDKALETVWQWFLPLIIPTLILILQRFIAEEKRGLKDKPPGSLFLFRLCIGLSILYLSLPLLQLLTIPISAPEAPLKWLKQSELWILGIQALPFAAIGYFFHKPEKG